MVAHLQAAGRGDARQTDGDRWVHAQGLPEHGVEEGDAGERVEFDVVAVGAGEGGAQVGRETVQVGRVGQEVVGCARK